MKHFRVQHEEKVKSIENEFQEPLKDILEDLINFEDYMGKHYSYKTICGILDINMGTLCNLVKKYNLKFPERSSPYDSLVDRLDDIIWIKTGLSSNEYFKQRRAWYSNESIYDELGGLVDIGTIKTRKRFK